MLVVMFQAVFTGAKPLMDAISGGFEALGTLVAARLPPGLLLSFLQDGVIAGVGSVIVFLPQIMILFLFILLLEDFGYMARAAFLMDRIMGGAGLHGRAFIPLLSSFACAIPGIMATRVIDQRRRPSDDDHGGAPDDLLGPHPVYTLIISAFIQAARSGPVQSAGLVMFRALRRGHCRRASLCRSFPTTFSGTRTPTPPFMLELPDYKLPGLASVVLNLWQRVKAFLHRAGTTIFSMMVLIWFLAPSRVLPRARSTQPSTTASRPASAVSLNRFWPHSASTGRSPSRSSPHAAREVSVAALGTVYAVAGGKEASEQIGQTLAQQWSVPTGLAFLAWFIFAPQCASTLAVIRRETGGWQWMLIAFAYMLVLAYLAVCDFPNCITSTVTATVMHGFML